VGTAGGSTALRRPQAGWLGWLAVAIATAALIVAGSLTKAGATGPAPPNILVIVSDDQRVGTVDGWMPKTLKWFRDGATGIAGGIDFQNAFATNPLCCPSRASIFTGRYSHNHKVFLKADLNSVAPGAPDFSAFHASTLQHYLKTRPSTPYLTGIFGKYLNFWPLIYPPPDFDRWAIWESGAHYSSVSSPSCAVPNGLNCINQNGTLVTTPNDLYETDYVTQQATDFIDYTESNDSQPWLMYLTPAIPHYPMTPQKDSRKNYSNVPVPPFQNNPNSFPTDDMAGKPEYVKDTKDRAYGTGIFANDPPYACSEPVPPGTVPPDVYKDCVLQRRDNQYRMQLSLDDMVDNVFTMLRAHGEEQNTLAFFISDNGMMWGEFWLEGKPHPYEDGARVPMFMRWPDNQQRVPQNFTDTRLVGNIDIAPTVMDAVGITPQPGVPMDGRSLLDAASGSAYRRSEILLERPARGRTQDPAIDTRERHVGQPPTWASLYTAPDQIDYSQYTEYYAQSDDTIGTPTPNWYELYDLHSDPFELNNRFGSNGFPDAGEPDATAKSADLASVRRCAGANGELLPYRPACP
jgi:arylsulfatase A-like enzyme